FFLAMCVLRQQSSMVIRRLPVARHFGIAASRLALCRFTFAPLQLFLLLLLLAAVATGALLAVVRFDSHVQSFALFLTCATRLGARSRLPRCSGFPICSFLGKAQRAQPRHLLHHGVVLALLLQLDARFLSLAPAQKRLRVPSSGADFRRKFGHRVSPDKEVRAIRERATVTRAAGSELARLPFGRPERLDAAEASERSGDHRLEAVSTHPGSA